MRSFRFSSRRAILIVAAGALAACSDATNPVAPETVPVEMPAPDSVAGIYPVVNVQPDSAGRFRVQVGLHLVKMNDRVGSYQAHVEYDPTRFTLDHAELPDGIAGSWNVEDNRVRFAGASVNGSQGEAMAVLYFSGTSTPSANALRLRVEEVTATGDFHDLTAALIQ